MYKLLKAMVTVTIACLAFRAGFIHSVLGQNINAEMGDIHVNCYRLNLRFNLKMKEYGGFVQAELNTKNPHQELWLDFVKTDQVVEKVSLNNVAVNFEQGPKAIRVFNLPGGLLNQGKHKLCTWFTGQMPIAKNPPWEGGFTDSVDSDGKPWIGLSCEAEGPRLWFPCFDNPMDEPDSVISTFSVPKGLKCISNGNLLETKQLPNRNTAFTWKVSYPINLYNLTVNIGNFVSFREYLKTENKHLLALDYYVLPKNLTKAKMHFKQVKPMLKCYQRLFGPYPFEKDGFALVETPYWGMEHQSAVSYGNNYKNLPEGFDFIIIHESGHEYWGNSITAKNRHEHWIHEGFTTYTETLFLECTKTPQIAKQYLDKQRKRIFNQVPLLGPDGPPINGMPDNDKYYKGAWVLHTLRSTLENDSLFKAVLKGLATTYASKVIDSDTIVAWLSNATGVNLLPFFDQFLHYARLPVLNYGIKSGSLWYKWVSDSKCFNMPVRMLNGSKLAMHLMPTTEWQKLSPNLPTDSLAGFQPDTTNFLIQTQRVMPALLPD